MQHIPHAWTLHPRAAALVEGALAEARRRHGGLDRFARDLAGLTGTRLVDWVDHLALGEGSEAAAELAALGYAPAEAEPAPLLAHPGALLPLLALAPGTAPVAAVAVRCDDLERFCAVNGVTAPVAGSEADPVRAVEISAAGGVRFLAVERRSYRAGGRFDPAAEREATLRFARRDRRGTPQEVGSRAAALARETAAEYGPDLAARAFHAAERMRYEALCRAAGLQRVRQDRLGLGFANRDHAAFRSSRAGFLPLLETMAALGFAARERFHAGAEAGWGAQVVEHPGTGDAFFLDVDLDPAEKEIDYLAAPLPERDRLGTIGLWCALHGDSLGEGGFHHLACRASFLDLGELFEADGAGMMKPFANLPHLRQAFTKGELRLVPAPRLDALEGRPDVAPKSLERFREKGASGAHVEVIERNAGFRGFGVHEVSAIIRDTDPRKG